MKKTIKYLSIFLSVVLMGAFTSCRVEEPNDPAALGLSVKVFSPTKVVTGQPMTINGSGLADTKEIVFPGDVIVTDFELVSNEMLRLTAPAGIAAEGGKILVRTSDEEAESRLPLTLGKTVVSGYSKQAGESADGGELITIYGKDLEFINGVELLDSDGNPNLVKDADFYRKGTNSVIFYVPRKNIFEGTFAGTVHTYDGQTFTMPELAYKPAKDSGHWETVKNILWENDGTPIPSWGGTFRFGLDGNDGGNECIATFPADVWALIKDGTVRVAVDVSGSSNIRITTGWWSAAYGGTEHNCIDFVQEAEDGTKYIELNIKEEGTLYDLIDQQHLLFTGSDYTLLYIYTEEEVWIEGEEGHWEIQSYWKNDGTVAAASWDGGSPYRFCVEGRETGEQVAAIPADLWEKMKTGSFFVTIRPEADWFTLRVVDGWWSQTWGGGDQNDIKPGDERLVDNGDGTFSIEIAFGEDPIVGTIDEKHLLFAGDAFTLLEIYNKVWVEGGGAAEEVVLWEGEAIADDWGNQPNLLSDAGVELQAAGAKVGQEIRFYITPTGDYWQLEIVEGHWSGVTYAKYSSPGADDGGKFTEWDLEANGGYVPLTITQEMLDTAYVQQWWGGTFIGNGDNVKITKITLF